MKIDIFNHIFPRRFFDRLLEVAPTAQDMPRRVRCVPPLVDLETRFRVMDEFGDYCQVLSLASPPLEMLADPDESPQLARLANDGLAELVDRYPQRFPAFVAALLEPSRSGRRRDAPGHPRTGRQGRAALYQRARPAAR
jgi:aminocarboxymuconate-semialdehyde decarboxylase